MFFLNAYMLLKEEYLKKTAEYAYRFMRNYYVDQKYGGVFWSVSYDGNVKDDTKHTYNQAFAIYALASYYDAAGDQEALHLAFELQSLIEEKCTDSVGYLEAFTRKFEPEENDKLFENGIDGFRFWDYPVVLPDTCPEETTDLSAAVAQAGIVRTKDLKTWERLENLKTLRSPQQRNVVIHPEFVNGKYAFYTRPMDSFIDTGSGGGIGFGLCDDIEHAVIDEEVITSRRVYHTLTEAKNGAGAVPIKGKKCWIHIAHGVRNTAAGLRYVLYAFGTDLNDPSKLVAEPSGIFLVPLGNERVGDVSNVVFTNGAIARKNGDVYIYYASCDTRMHVAVTTIDKLEDYLFHTPKDPLRSSDCVRQRCELIDKNMEILKEL